MRVPLWLCVCVQPRAMITRVIAIQSTSYVFAIAALSGMFGVGSSLSEITSVADLWDWRLALLVTLVGAILGILGSQIFAFFLNSLGKFLGANASFNDTRALVVFAQSPQAFGFCVLLTLMVVVQISLPGDTARIANLIISGISIVAAIWSAVLIVFLFSLSQKVSIGRAIPVYLMALLLPAALGLIVRTIAFQTLSVQAMSMAPNLVVKDYFFVSKYAYGYSQYSLPFGLNLFAGRILEKKAERGDVVAFIGPQDGKTIVAKRVVGLPGDRIRIEAEGIYLNGEPLPVREVDAVELSDSKGRSLRLTKFIESLPSGRTYEILRNFNAMNSYNFGYEYVVPPGHYFGIGDNRDNSNDSRYLDRLGYIPAENLIGRAEMIFFSTYTGAEGEQPRVVFDRIGLSLR